MRLFDRKKEAKVIPNRSFGALGRFLALWCDLGRPVGRLWAAFAASCAPRSRLWAPFGAPLGRLWAARGATWASFGVFRGAFSPKNGSVFSKRFCGSLFGPCWEGLGTIWGAFWYRFRWGWAPKSCWFLQGRNTREPTFYLRKT